MSGDRKSKIIDEKASRRMKNSGDTTYDLSWHVIYRGDVCETVVN
jgi:hypothetical protein